MSYFYLFSESAYKKSLLPVVIQIFVISFFLEFVFFFSWSRGFASFWSIHKILSILAAVNTLFKGDRFRASTTKSFRMRQYHMSIHSTHTSILNTRPKCSVNVLLFQFLSNGSPVHTILGGRFWQYTVFVSSPSEQRTPLAFVLSVGGLFWVCCAFFNNLKQDSLIPRYTLR